MTRRRLILIAFNWTRDKDPRVPLGHASLLTAVQSRGRVDVHSLVVPVNGAHAPSTAQLTAEILRATRGRRADQVDVAIGVYVWGEDRVQSLTRELRRQGFAGRIVLGGPQISYSGPGLEQLYPEADVFIRGYGEAALVALTESTESQEIPGVHWAHTPDRVAQAQVDLATIPSPWLSGTVPLKGQRFVRWETQRGCPYRCAFCQHREPGALMKRRELDLDRVQREVDRFCASSVDDIAVLDPIFNASPHALALLERFKHRGFEGRLSLQCRAERTDTAFLRACADLRVRLEFGLQSIHRDEGRAIRRVNRMERVETALRQVHDLKIPYEVSLIFGLPNQTLSSFEASVQWCLEQRVPVIKAFPLLLLRGTALDRERDRWGFETTGGAMPMVQRATTFSTADWHQMARLSEALKRTEGSHPRTLDALRQIAATLQPNTPRWVA